MTTPIKQLKDAAKRAEDISAAADDRTITIKVRSYGFIVDGQRDVEGEDKLRLRMRQVPWGKMDSINNPLLAAVEAVNEELGSD
jgi:hypothetical protein